MMFTHSFSRCLLICLFSCAVSWLGGGGIHWTIGRWQFILYNIHKSILLFFIEWWSIIFFSNCFSNIPPSVTLLSYRWNRNWYIITRRRRVSHWCTCIPFSCQLCLLSPTIMFWWFLIFWSYTSMYLTITHFITWMSIMYSSWTTFNSSWVYWRCLWTAI